jgi:hypothetical protein
MKRFLIALACLLSLLLPLELKAQGGQSQPIRYGTTLPACNATSTKNQFYLQTTRTLYWCNGVAWVTVGSGIVDIQSGTTTPTLSQADNQGLLDVTNSTPMTVTLAQPGTGAFIQNFWCMFHNSGSATLSFSPTGSTLNGSGNNITVGPGTWGVVYIDQTNNWRIGSGNSLPASLISALPTASLNNGYVSIVLDGISASDCTAGGGNRVSICRSNGTTYVNISSPDSRRTLGWAFGDLATGTSLTTSEVGYVVTPFACTIVAWRILANAGTAAAPAADSGNVTIKVARVTGGTALPTIGSNSISTSGVTLPNTATQIVSNTLTDFTSLLINSNDTLGFFITSVATAKQVTFQLDCAQ